MYPMSALPRSLPIPALAVGQHPDDALVPYNPLPVDSAAAAATYQQPQHTEPQAKEAFPFSYHDHPTPFTLSPQQAKWNIDVPTILAVLGLPACMKVIAALDHKEIPYHIYLVRPPAKKTFTAEWSDQFPVMRLADIEISDSSKILKFLDQYAQGHKFFPFPHVEAMESWLSNVLDLFILYFTWIDEEGFRASLHNQVNRQIPFFLRWLFTPDVVTKEYKARIMARLQQSQIPESFETKDAAAIGLVQQLQRLDNILKDNAKKPLAHTQSGGIPAVATPSSDSDVRYLCNTPEPSAADFALYGMLQRLVGWSGDACIPPCRPYAFTEANTPTLCAWFNHMLSKYPIRFIQQQ